MGRQDAYPTIISNYKFVLHPIQNCCHSVFQIESLLLTIFPLFLLFMSVVASLEPSIDTLPEINRSLTAVRDLGIAMLIDLAQQGEINPWDVQVIDAIDRHLKNLLQTTNSQESEANLSQGGQAFVWAAMLVLLKAHTLDATSVNEEDSNWELDVVLDDNNSISTRLPINIEECLKRRHTAQHLAKRPITLNEVIEQLHQIAATLADKPNPQVTRRVKPLSASAAAQTIVGLAHQENLTEIATELELFIASQGEKSFLAQKWINLEQLIEIWTSSHNLPKEESKKDLVGVFWALLLLSAQSKVELSQQEFYQEIKVRAI
jgi:segregation and condensation protein A